MAVASSVLDYLIANESLDNLRFWFVSGMVWSGSLRSSCWIGGMSGVFWKPKADCILDEVRALW